MHAPALIPSIDVQKTLCNSVNISLNESCSTELEAINIKLGSSLMKEFSFNGMFTELHNVFCELIESIRAGACTV